MSPLQSFTILPLIKILEFEEFQPFEDFHPLPLQENNWYPKDLSSTEPYQRDNFFHFLL